MAKSPRLTKLWCLGGRCDISRRNSRKNRRRRCVRLRCCPGVRKAVVAFCSPSPTAEESPAVNAACPLPGMYVKNGLSAARRHARRPSRCRSVRLTLLRSALRQPRPLAIVGFHRFNTAQSPSISSSSKGVACPCVASSLTWSGSAKPCSPPILEEFDFSVTASGRSVRNMTESVPLACSHTETGVILYKFVTSSKYRGLHQPRL